MGDDMTFEPCRTNEKGCFRISIKGHGLLFSGLTENELWAIFRVMISLAILTSGKKLK